MGDPTVCVAWLAECGCDTCDSAWQNELDQLDRIVLDVISGPFRRLTCGSRQITQFDGDGWSASGCFARQEVDDVLADPEGWHEVSGLAWIDGG